jgi:hypothetical protein
MFGKASPRHAKPSGNRRRPPTRPAVEQLEARAVPATTFTVTNLAPSDSGSLRQAVLGANATPGADTITFQPGLGGPITLTGPLDITDSVTIQGPGSGVITVSGNDASRIFVIDDGATGAINVGISGLTLTTGNAGTNGDGGAIEVADEALTLSGVVVTGNTANMGSGGGIHLGTAGRLTLEDSTVSGNQASRGGGISSSGVVVVRNSTISGNRANASGGIFSSGPGNLVRVENSTVSDNKATSDSGGGISVLSGMLQVRNSTISGNSAAGGCGGISTSLGSLTLEDSTVSGNQAGFGGAGGISSSFDLVVVRNCTISGNKASGSGGGIFVGGLPRNSTAIENCTISGNSASGDGGGIRISQNPTVVIRNSTIAFNNSDSDNAGGGTGGGLSIASDGATLQSTLVGDNTAGTTGAHPDDISGTVTATNSLVQSTAGTIFAPGSANNVLGVDPLLGPLADNGGPTKTHALLPGSPALDHGANPAGQAADQRGPGFARLSGAGVDIGAFELELPPPPLLPPPSQIVASVFRQRGVARVRVRDAASGALRGVLTPFKGFAGRLRLQLLDVNGDGSLDLIVQAVIHGKRKKKVFDAVTLAPLPPGLA